MQRLLIIGCGDVVQRALPWLTQRFRVFAVARNDSQREALRACGVVPILADLDDAASLRRLAGVGQAVIHSAPPQQTGERDERTRRLVAALGRSRILPRRLVYISTSGVYGNCAGEWVAETRPVRPQTGRGKRRADAEAVLRRFGRRSGVRVSVVRAPGIYASDRLPLDRLRRGDPVLAPEYDVFTNHIHADDLARITALMLFRGRAGRAYNASDDSGLKMGEYYDLVADAFGLPRPPRVSPREADKLLSPLTRSFMEESRRLVNRRIKRELRVRLRYPDVARALPQQPHSSSDSCSG